MLVFISELALIRKIYYQAQKVLFFFSETKTYTLAGSFLTWWW